MRAKQINAKLTAVLATTVTVILVLIPFHAFLTVWASSIVGHYTLLRLWKEILLVFLLLASLYLLYKDPKLRWRLISYKLHWLFFGYLLIQVIWGIVAFSMDHVTAKALGYGLIIDLRFLAFFLVVSEIAGYTPKLTKEWPKWVIRPAVVVILFALLQYFVFPANFLTHFGYSAQTIPPYETINNNIHHLRAFSTLRGTNPLGAYLVVVLSLIAVLFYKRRQWWLGAVFVAGLGALCLTFSRSAWVGLAISLIIISWNVLKTKRAKQLALGSVACLVVLAGIVTAALWHNTAFQDAVFHTDDRSTIKISSNQAHSSALKNGVTDLLHEPLGRGPGTAGPASVYNNHPARIAENYFVQIGQETGWAGLLIFVAINLVVARALWRRRQQTLALALFASLISLTFVNLLSHAWADDTLAYLWWGLAGIAIATELNSRDEPYKKRA